MSKYRELAPGLFQCTACGLVLEGAFVVQEKRAHSRDHADGTFEEEKRAALEAKSLPRLAQLVEHKARPGYGEEVKKGDGYTRPDKYGRWRIGKTPLQKRMISYFRICHKMDMSELTREKFIEHLLSDGCFPRWAGKTSPLQQLSYAYTHLGWEEVKGAAFNLAYDEAVKRHVEELFEEFFEGDL